MIKLSIVIPMYNVENYIGKCLTSCLNQDLSVDEYEIVVVDDGSSDNSVSIVKKYMRKVKNIRLIMRSNGGMSVARNAGLKEAIGEYVWFIDSDDWIKQNCLVQLVSFAEQNKLDVLCFGLQLVYSNEDVSKYNVVYEENEKVYNGKEFITKVEMPPAPWAALYRNMFLKENNLWFYEGILHEDQEFTPRAYFLAERIAFYDKIIYNYNQRAGSIMKSKNNERRCRDLLTVADSLYLFLQKHDPIKDPAYFKMLEKVAFVFSQSLYYNHKTIPLKVYKQKPYYPIEINYTMTNRQKWKYRILNFSIPLFTLMTKIK